MDLLIKSGSAINSLISFLIILLIQKHPAYAGEFEYTAPIISGIIVALLIYIIGKIKVKKLKEEVAQKINETQKAGDDSTTSLLAVINSLPDGNKAKDVATEELTKAIRTKGEILEHKKIELHESVDILNKTKKQVGEAENSIAEAMSNLVGKKTNKN